MFKKFLYVLLAAITICLTACGNEEVDSASHKHSWAEATCTEPKTCTTCGTKKGEPLGHTAIEIEAIGATCTTAGLTSGSKCSVCSEIIFGCEEISPVPHSTRFGFCSSCGGRITELLPQAEMITDYLTTAFNAIASAQDSVNNALRLSNSKIPAALNNAFSYVDPANDALIDAYVIADTYEEFSYLKEDLNTLYAIVLCIQDLQATSSNYISTSYDFVGYASLYSQTYKAIITALAASVS